MPSPLRHPFAEYLERLARDETQHEEWARWMVNHYFNDDILEQIRANVVRLSISDLLKTPESQRQLLAWSQQLRTYEHDQV